MSTTLIEVRDLWFSYNGIVVLKEVNLDIHKGEFLTLVGPNGGGKSTLLKLITGLLKPDKGEVMLRGKSKSLSALSIGYVPQNINIRKGFPICVRDVVLMGRLSPGWGRLSYCRHDKQMAEALLDKMGLWRYRHQRINELSGGQQQRVLIARALLTDPQILILDEPAANLDIQAKNGLYSLLEQISRKVTIVMASHDIGSINRFANSVVRVAQSVGVYDTACGTTVLQDSTYMSQVPLDALAGA